jgi:hypothetical protein
MNTNDYIDIANRITGTPGSRTTPMPTAPVDTALEIAKRQAEIAKEQKPDVVPSQGAMPIPN